MLDTNACIGVINGYPPVLRRLLLQWRSFPSDYPAGKGRIILDREAMLSIGPDDMYASRYAVLEAVVRGHSDCM